MAQKTALYEQHRKLGAKIVDFGGWQMPLNYGSQLDEHHAVRRDVGMFDVSHMTIVEIQGAQAQPFLQHLLANDVSKLKVPGKALYSCMLNEQGGIIDDLIVYFFDVQNYRVVVNAATRDKDLAWIQRQAESFSVAIVEREDLAMLAVQGPNARTKVLEVLDQHFQSASELAKFTAKQYGEWCIARTGYTGEDGFEIILPNQDIGAFWQALIEAGVAPCGLGARDTLRLEAGMNLYGLDMTEQTSPLVSGLSWTVAWEPAERDFIGRAALMAQRGQAHDIFVGLLLQDKGVLRSHQQVTTNGGGGETTSGSFSPTLGKSIGFARVPAGSEGECTVAVRGKALQAKIVKIPFVRDGKSLVDG